jgi:hypothetical protein
VKVRSYIVSIRFPNALSWGGIVEGVTIQLEESELLCRLGLENAYTKSTNAE